MKKILIVLLLLVVSFVAIPGLAGAVADPSDPGAFGPPSEYTEVWDAIDYVINWLFWLLIIAATIMIILAAFTFLTSAGEAEKVTRARNMIVYALLALVVAFMARALVNWLMAQLGYGEVVSALSIIV